MRQNSVTDDDTFENEYLFKILIVGDIGTGKTSIVKRYVHNVFSMNCKPTIGVDFALKTLKLDKQTIARLQLWDIAGQERFGTMTRVYYREAVGAFIVFDVSRSSSFDAVAKWKQDIDAKVTVKKTNKDTGAEEEVPVPVVLLANKSDLARDGWHKTPEGMDQYCKENGFAGWFETSAKENTNIDKATKFLVSEVLKNEGVSDLHKKKDDDLVVSTTPRSRCWCSS